MIDMVVRRPKKATNRQVLPDDLTIRSMINVGLVDEDGNESHYLPSRDEVMTVWDEGYCPGDECWYQCHPHKGQTVGEFLDMVGPEGSAAIRRPLPFSEEWLKRFIKKAANARLSDDLSKPMRQRFDGQFFRHMEEEEERLGRSLKEGLDAAIDAWNADHGW